jgi:CubicO group peptidase (beta-lactamase class C family)
MNPIETRLQRVVDQGHTPSVQYVYFNQDTIVYAYRRGYADIRQGVPVSPSTTYPVFSLTKTFTALSILQLVQQRRVDLHQPIQTYLPSLEGSVLPGEDAITPYHLLAHLSGLNDPWPLGWIHLAADHTRFNRNAYFSPILEARLRTQRKAAQAYRYSNLGYVLLGQVLEAVTGKPYEQYVVEQIIQPLKLSPHELGFTIADEGLYARGYQSQYSLMGLLLSLFLDKATWMDPAEGKWRPFKTYYVNGAPYGGLIGSLTAFVAYGQTWLRGDTPLIGKDYRQLLFTEGQTRSHQPTGMCLSWFKGHLGSIPYYCHAGGGGGYYCELRLNPRQGTGSFVVFNRTGFRDERYLDQLDGYWF